MPLEHFALSVAIVLGMPKHAINSDTFVMTVCAVIELT